MSSRNSYGANLVNYMLTKEQVFKQFRSCYYLLYQCLVPNTREALSLLVQHYSVPKDFERNILSGENPRVCNQGILNYLLIKLRTDKNFVKFWKVVKTMIKNPVLRRAVEEIQRGIHHPSIVSIQSIMRHHDTTLDTDSVFPLEQRALSVTDSDDDYCVSYIVTMVDVRSCTRPPRSHNQQHISEYPHTSLPPRSPYQIHINECTGISMQPKSLYPHSSTNVGIKVLQSHYSVLVRSMPDDYMNTVSQLERHLTGDHIGSILECRDVFTANQRILDCLIEQINTKEGLLDFCEQLNSITNTPALTAVIASVKKECIELITATSEATNVITTITTAITHTTTNTTTATTSSSVSVATPTTVQITSSQNSTVSSESHYSVLVRSMPDDYMNTVNQLERHLTGDHIGSVLECRDVFTANQRILDCLIEQINTKEGLLDFCNWLSTITDAPALTAALKEFKKDVIVAIEANSSTASNFNVQTFINKSPGLISINSAYELSDVFIDATLSQYGPKGIATLKMHYNNLLMSLPEDHMITLQRFYNIGIYKLHDEVVNEIVSSTDSQQSNKKMFNLLISIIQNDNQLLGLSFLIERLATAEVLSECPNIESFRNDCLQVIMEKGSKLAPTFNVTTTTATTSTSTTKTTTATATKIVSTCVSLVSKQSSAEFTSIQKSNVQSITDMKLLYKLVIPKISAHWDVVLANLEYDLAFKQELDRKYRGNPRECCTALLEDWIGSDRGINPKTFNTLLKVLCTINDIAPFMRSIIDGLRKEGIDIGDLIVPTVLPVVAKEIQFQFPPTCPANHVPRVELLKEISSAVLNNDITSTIGTTVTIRGIGGIGKSTIAKALCHDPLIKKHFVNGFLWISLTPPLPSLVTMLTEIYQRLADKSTTPNISVLINKLKSLVSNPSCKLLVILDDVWEAKDAMMFVDVFSSCKMILTTRKMNINAKIPPVVCFDIQPMSINEAVKLLTLQIIDIETLHPTNVRRVQKLAKDLHYWPLLLHLVHGQLYYHCIEWNESPQNAILRVQQKLFDNGLTAFDPEDQLEASRENAVRASITASLKLLDKNEEIILFSTASSVIGFGMYTFKDVLSAALQMDPKQFDKYARNLWCHGLISFEDVTIPNVNTKIPCIGIHEIIAHYINDNMPDQFYLHVAKFAQVFIDLFFNKYFNLNVVTNIGQLFLSQTDAIKIPFYIRLLIITAKCYQIHFFRILNKFQPLQNHNIILNQNIQFPSLTHMHRIIEQDCKTIHSLLADGEYNETITWAKQCFDNHPLKLTLETIFINLKILHDSFKNVKRLQFVIEDYISVFTENFQATNALQRDALCYIVAYHHVLYLVNAAASDDDVKHYLKCNKIIIA